MQYIYACVASYSTLYGQAGVYNTVHIVQADDIFTDAEA